MPIFVVFVDGFVLSAFVLLRKLCVKQVYISVLRAEMGFSRGIQGIEVIYICICFTMKIMCVILMAELIFAREIQDFEIVKATKTLLSSNNIDFRMIFYP